MMEIKLTTNLVKRTILQKSSNTFSVKVSCTAEPLMNVYPNKWAKCARKISEIVWKDIDAECLVFISHIFLQQPSTYFELLSSGA